MKRTAEKKLTSAPSMTHFLPTDFEKRAVTGHPIIRINATMISFTKSVRMGTGLKGGDKVLISQDNDHPAIWYLSKNKDGFQLKSYKKDKQPGLCLHCRALSLLIMGAFQSDSVIKMLCDTDEPIEIKGVKYWKLTLFNDGEEEEPETVDNNTELPTKFAS